SSPSDCIAWLHKSGVLISTDKLLPKRVYHLTSAMTVVSGSNVSLQISEGLPDNYEQLTWFYTIDQKIVEWDSGKSKYFDSKFKGRVMLDPQSGALNIYNVQKEDSSTYLMRVSNATGKEQEWKVLLEVLGELGETKGKSAPQGQGIALWEEERKTSGQT
uniref:CD48 antigen n=1 Tax=Propithecus coquereli TaxID=379532 RepID=A0A2K6EJH5_PROCO